MMALKKLKPSPLEIIKEPILDFRIRRAIAKRKEIQTRTVNDTQDYWSVPDDGHNAPSTYVNSQAGQVRSERLVEIMKLLVPQEAKILEIGCNAGRNLHYLYNAGFKNLSAIEISKNAIMTMSDSYPETYEAASIYNSPVEEMITKFGDEQFDVVFSVAVLQHIHPESEWIFEHMARIAKQYIVTMEAEAYASWRHFPRSYKKVFEGLGMKQLRRFNGARIFGKHK